MKFYYKSCKITFHTAGARANELEKLDTAGAGRNCSVLPASSSATLQIKHLHLLLHHVVGQVESMDWIKICFPLSARAVAYCKKTYLQRMVDDGHAWLK